MKETQISAYISEETKRELDRLVRSRGLKKGFVVEQALRHHLQALRALPEDVVIPPAIVLDRESFEKVAGEVRSPSRPTPALRRLMKGKPVADDDLH